MQVFDPTIGSWYDPATHPFGSGYTPAGSGSFVWPQGGASNTAAQLLAAQMQDWEQTYKPVELNLLSESSVNNPEVLSKAVGQAGTNVTQSYGAMEGVQQRQMAAQGIAPTPQQAAVMKRMNNLSMGTAMASGENQARKQVAYQDDLIALGSAPNPNVVQQATNSKY
jgi:hypothetical protein